MQPASASYTFGRFHLDSVERRLSRDGQAIPLTPKVFDTLLTLVQHSGHALTKEELMRAVWPDGFVEEVNLAYNISVLRKALADGQSGEKYIETVPKLGYRFVAPVQTKGHSLSPSTAHRSIDGTFGDLLSQHLHRKHGLSQSKLAAGILQAPTVITGMCKGRRLSGLQARERVVAIIRWLHAQSALETVAEANALLTAAGMASLRQGEPSEFALIQQLHANPLENTRQLVHELQKEPQIEARRRTNLPAQLTRFIGREREITKLADAAQAKRLVTLTGAGGVGKTRLALEVAASVQDAFADGVWMVEFAPIADAELVTQATAAALDVTEQPGASLLDLLLARLRNWQALLIFDNCEHLVAACATLAERLLRARPDLHILVTSREPLRVEGEVTWRVPSLRTPDVTMVGVNGPSPLRSKDVSRSPLLEYESVQLFIERAHANQPQFEVTTRNAATIAQICHRLDGIPLAIELAAARVNTLSVEQIAARLDDRFNLLTSGSRTALARHQTLKAAIAWSIDLLTPPERELLTQLSVFAGGFTAEAAEAISPQPHTLDLLSKLVAKSLVIADVSDRAARYRLLETIRQFALEQLREAGEANAARDRHLAYFLKLAEAAEIEMGGEELRECGIRLEQDLDNIRAALTWSYDCSNLETGLRLTGALWLFWCVQEHAREGLAWVDKFLEAGGDACVPIPVRAKALYGATAMAWRTQESADMLTYAQIGLMLSRESEDAVGVVLCLIYLEYFAQAEFNYQRVQTLLEEALSLLGATQHLWSIGLVRLLLGEVFIIQGKFVSGIAALEESLSLFQKLDWWLLYTALYYTVTAALAQGDLKRAKALAQHRLVLGRESGRMRMCCRGLRELGNIALREGDYRGAAESFEECIALFRKFGYVEPSITHSLADLGLVSHLQGDHETASQRFNEALAFYTEISKTVSIGHVRLCLGYAFLTQDDLSRAQMQFKEGVKLSYKVGSGAGVANGLAGIGYVSQAQGYAQRAAKMFGFAAKLSSRMKIEWFPAERADYERTLADAQSRLYDPELAAAWEEGATMTLDEAVAFALANE